MKCVLKAGLAETEALCDLTARQSAPLPHFFFFFSSSFLLSFLVIQRKARRRCRSFDSMTRGFYRRSDGMRRRDKARVLLIAHRLDTGRGSRMTTRASDLVEFT